MGEGIIVNVEGETSKSGRTIFTLKDAFRLSLKHLTGRRDRSAIIMASIALSISFSVALASLDAFQQAAGFDGILSARGHQYWMMMVALAVSVICVMNTMLISVYERFREIGTMKSLGAFDRHILMLFLSEALIEGLIGGVVGMILGLTLTSIHTWLSSGLEAILQAPWDKLLTISSVSLLLSILLSLGGAFYPAYRASKLMPVEALRFEP